MPNDERRGPGIVRDPLAPAPREEASAGDRRDAVADPYGPQDFGTDEAAGGADSSPYESVPTDERPAAADRPQDANRGAGETRNG
jgi:hypothetical protein